MLQKFLNYLVRKAYPDREYSVEKIGGRFFINVHDSVGSNHYLLEGEYSYDEVIRLNDLTNYNAGFGFCKELGPVAFIGVPNVKCVSKDGYFKYNVHEYGVLCDESEYHFSLYTDETAKKIKNYTVYGLFMPENGSNDISKFAKISKLACSYDSRYAVKRKERNKVYDMDCKLKGIYSFDKAKLLATGTTEKKNTYTGSEHPISFATVGDNYHVGIIEFNSSKARFMSGFRDVWEYGCEEPEIQTIRLLSDEEASKIDKFVLYIYDYSHVYNDKYPVDKIDRTLDKRFNFHLPDGTDYRLIDHNELFR